MQRIWFFSLALLFLGGAAFGQTSPNDSLIAREKELMGKDSLIYDDLLFQDFESFMDSILSPHSYFMPSLSVSRSYFSYTGKDGSSLETKSRITFTPMLTYYHKNGLGISATGYMLNNDKSLLLYQGSVTGSYDYLKDHDLATGITYTRYFSKDSLPFYTSPLSNEVYGYFTYRKWWIKPTIAASYGWGSRSEYQQREELIQSLRLRPRGYTYINTKETISDFSVITSIRHDFYWLDVFRYNDHVRITPQVSFTSGTQKFGFNQTSETYGTTLRNATNVLYSSDNVYLDDQINFQPISLSVYLRTEYSIGKFFVQPQIVVDYYFPASSNRLTSLYSLNLGLVL